MTMAIERLPATMARIEFSPEQQQIIRDQFARGADDGEFAVLMEIAKARRLNPLLRQIFFVKRWDSEIKRDVWATQTAIDGLRLQAERTGVYSGQDEPEFIYDGDGDKLVCAKVRVYRRDWERPAVGVAYFSEFVQHKRDGQPTRFWRAMPHIMLAKCAEALAIRKAFPEETSGLYIAEEIRHEPKPSDSRPSAVELPPPARPLESDDEIMARWKEAFAGSKGLDDLANVAKGLKTEHLNDELRGRLLSEYRARRDELAAR